MKKIKIVADSKIPFLRGALDQFANMEYLDPMEITSQNVRDADGLIIRTRTICDTNLLKNTNVKFIATATIGYDHIDTLYCQNNGIKWVNAPGCNSSSVMQYIASALANFSISQNIELPNITIGVVGVGNVGRKVAKLSGLLGMKVLLNDPPRQRNEKGSLFSPLEEIMENSDIITFHVPLVAQGINKTFHMADESFFERLKTSKVIFNTSRGPVIDSAALIKAIKKSKVSFSVLDVWENEPQVDPQIIESINIATPHIAGYSVEGKAIGTAVCVREAASFFNLPIGVDWYPANIPLPEHSEQLIIDCSQKTSQEVILQAINYSYDIMSDDRRLRLSPATFENQRSSYPVRREFPFYKIRLINNSTEIEHTLSLLGFNIVK